VIRSRTNESLSEQAIISWGYKEREWNIFFFFVELNHIKKIEVIASETPLKPQAEETLLILPISR
jgi:hypothetical protein